MDIKSKLIVDIPSGSHQASTKTLNSASNEDDCEPLFPVKNKSSRITYSGFQSSPVHNFTRTLSSLFSSQNIMGTGYSFQRNIRPGLGNWQPLYVESSKNSHPISIKFEDEDDDPLFKDSAIDLCSMNAVILLSLWYFFSFSTLFLNKYILTYLKGDPTVLGTVQMMSTTVCGLVQLYVTCGLFPVVDREGQPPRFIFNMLAVGIMRFVTVVLGLVALKYVAVSFTETIKSSAPLFTVIMTRAILGEKTGLLVNLALVPVMGGLALCTVNELSFNMIGFLAALATNIVECLQNVYSKMLISGEKYKYTPAELQFYTSLAASVVQIPTAYFFIDVPQVISEIDRHLAMAFVLDGVFFHFQSITAYALMSYISPITHSVANTAKRASLIWLSVVIFGNQVTYLSGLGSVIVLIGVLLYTKARQIEGSKPIPVTGKIIKI